MKKIVRAAVYLLIFGFLMCVTSYAQSFDVTVSGGSTVSVLSEFSDTEKLKTVLCRRGANMLFDFHSWTVFDEKGRETFSSVNDSDCFSPYVVFANEKAWGDNQYTYDFTGGNHDYSNHDGGKSPTARSEGVHVFVDGVLKGEYSGKAQKLEIQVMNIIQGSNTKRENGYGQNVIREQITLTFDGKTWAVKTKVTALCDVTLRRYYGYCLSAAALGNRVEYLYPDRKSHETFYDFYNSQSDGRNCRGMLLSGGEIDVVMKLSEETDTYTNNTSSYSAFFTDYGKMYFNIIYGNNPKTMKKGESFVIGGLYEFLKHGK